MPDESKIYTFVSNHLCSCDYTIHKDSIHTIIMDHGRRTINCPRCCKALWLDDIERQSQGASLRATATAETPDGILLTSYCDRDKLAVIPLTQRQALLLCAQLAALAARVPL